MSLAAGVSTPLHKHRSEIANAADSIAATPGGAAACEEEVTNVKVYLRAR